MSKCSAELSIFFYNIGPKSSYWLSIHNKFKVNYIMVYISQEFNNMGQFILFRVCVTSKQKIMASSEILALSIVCV